MIVVLFTAWLLLPCLLARQSIFFPSPLSLHIFLPQWSSVLSIQSAQCLWIHCIGSRHNKNLIFLSIEALKIVEPTFLLYQDLMHYLLTCCLTPIQLYLLLIARNVSQIPLQDWQMSPTQLIKSLCRNVQSKKWRRLWQQYYWSAWTQLIMQACCWFHHHPQNVMLREPILALCWKAGTGKSVC